MNVNLSTDALEEIFDNLNDELAARLEQLTAMVLMLNSWVKSGYLKEKIANNLGHQAVKAFKMSNRDSANLRAYIRQILVDLMDLSDEWQPAWIGVPDNTKL